MIDVYETWAVVPSIGHAVRHWPTDRRGEVVAAIGGVCSVRFDEHDDEVLPDDLLIVVVSEDLGRG